MREEGIYTSRCTPPETPPAPGQLLAWIRQKLGMAPVDQHN